MFLSDRSKYALNPIEEEDALAEKLAASGKKIIKLNRGDPPVYFPTPPYILNAYIEALKEGKTTYTNATGVGNLKDAIRTRYKRMYRMSLKDEDIIVTQGVSEALMFLNSSLINEGDSAILFKPYYPLYLPLLNLYGGKEILERYDEGDAWNVHIDGLAGTLKTLRTEKKLDRVKYILITNPNNPTGTVLKREVLEELVSLANEYGIFLVSDEIYDEIVYNGAKFTSVGEIAKGVPHMILNGASKDYDATGFRLGYALVPGEDEKSILLKSKFADFARVRLSANLPAQYAFTEGMVNTEGHANAISAMVREIESRVNYATALLKENPYLEVVRPNGAFYLFPKVDMKSLRFKTDKELVDKLLMEEGVQLTRGSGFGAQSHVRIVSLPPQNILEDAIGKLNAFCRKNASRRRR